MGMHPRRTTVLAEGDRGLTVEEWPQGLQDLPLVPPSRRGERHPRAHLSAGWRRA